MESHTIFPSVCRKGLAIKGCDSQGYHFSGQLSPSSNLYWGQTVLQKKINFFILDYQGKVGLSF